MCIRDSLTGIEICRILGSISDKLQLLCDSEKVTISSEALDLIARKSTGSLRDAENFLEQAIVSFGSEITLDNLLEFFNIDDNQFPIQIITKIVESISPIFNKFVFALLFAFVLVVVLDMLLAIVLAPVPLCWPLYRPLYLLLFWPL